jgi:hypothetical protein
LRHGHLAVETHVDRTGLVRLFVAEHSPAPEADDSRQPQVRYVARFNDSEAALMHAHEHLKRRLIDPDSRLYRASLEQAVAAIETIELRHRRIYLDPNLGDGSLDAIDSESRRFRRIQERRRRFFEAMGYIGIGLLLFNLFVLSIA